MSRLFEFTDGHDRDCEYRRVAAMGLAYECEHGQDVCSICDPCTCDRSEPIEPLRSRAIGTRDWPHGCGDGCRTIVGSRSAARH